MKRRGKRLDRLDNHNNASRGKFAAAGQKVENLLELPAGSLIGVSRLEITGNRQAVVEGVRGIIEYSEETAKLAGRSGTLVFRGRGLTLSHLTADSAVITGYIISVEFL
ncbi:MAG: YabP/YqfC family sporulation protein [Oscillospiraceae bacterium]|nr:YabP/YqfC family sporulation protein [Oscillospiraceae bacterium]